jgi:hypothetical protein
VNPSAQYQVTLEGISAFVDNSMLVNTYDTRTRREADQAALLPPSAAQGPSVDLTPLLAAKTVTRVQRRDVGFTLAALAQGAHLNLYQEDFLRVNTQGERSGDDILTSDLSSVGLTTLKGPLSTLIAAICAHWGYLYTRVGDDYLFWSGVWAQDRADDIPERLIALWQQRLKRQGTLTVDARAEIAASLPLRQILLTLNPVLSEAGPWSPTSYAMFRFLGQISAEEKAAALSDTGLACGSLPPWEREAFVSDFHNRLKGVSDDQLARAVIRFELEEDSKTFFQRVTLNVTSDDALILSVRDAVRMPKPPSLPGAPF